MSFPLGRIGFVARIDFAALPTIVRSSDVRYDIPKMHSERPLLMSSDWLPTLLCSSSKRLIQSRQSFRTTISSICLLGKHITIGSLVAVVYAIPNNSISKMSVLPPGMPGCENLP